MTDPRPRRPSLRPPQQLGPMPAGRPMETIDQQLVRASVRTAFEVVRHVEEWPAHLSHYRYVRFREFATDGGGLVEMAANRPFVVFVNAKTEKVNILHRRKDGKFGLIEVAVPS